MIQKTIISHLDYCSAFYIGLPLKVLCKLQCRMHCKLQCRMQWQNCWQLLLGQIISILFWNSCIGCWLNFIFKVLAIIFKALNGLIPSYLVDHLFQHVPIEICIPELIACLWCLAPGTFTWHTWGWRPSLWWPCPKRISCQMIMWALWNFLTSARPTKQSSFTWLFFSWVYLKGWLFSFICL